MSAAKAKKKPSGSGLGIDAITGQFEHAFLAGLGAMSKTRKAGAKTFDALVAEGEAFRERASDKTESLIDDVQKAIRNMTSKAEFDATGLMDKVRDASNLDRLQDVFDTRVAAAMDRLNVPSKNDINEINRKLDAILKRLEARTARGAATARRTTKKTAAKTAKRRTAA